VENSEFFLSKGKKFWEMNKNPSPKTLTTKYMKNFDFAKKILFVVVISKIFLAKMKSLGIKKKVKTPFFIRENHLFFMIDDFQLMIIKSTMLIISPLNRKIENV
jgi:hypothetical protein